MWWTRVAGACLLMATAGCGGPTPDAHDAAVGFDLPEVSPYWPLDPSNPRDVGRPDHPDVNPCADGLTSCSRRLTCVDLRTDRGNCGACGVLCQDRQDCRDGACVALPDDEAVCDGARVHLGSDGHNCGGCGRSCGSGAECIASQCETFCQVTELRCPGAVACVDLQRDPAHCGACATACGTGEECRVGVCVPPCTNGRSACAGTSECVDLQTDLTRCGSCDHPCSGRQVCEGGLCQTRCAEGSTRCARDVCFDLRTDSWNCGACGAMCPRDHATSVACQTGECLIHCVEGYAQCAGPRSPCTALFGADAANCGACGRVCQAGESCVTGECIGPGIGLLSPLSGTLNASRRPLFRWVPPPEGGAVLIEVCAARDCATVEGSQTVMTGDQIRWPEALSPGAHWWRVRQPGAAHVAVPVWEVFIPEGDSPVPLVGDTQPDFNSDGVIDSTAGLTTGCVSTRLEEDCTSVAGYGDGNGDGFVDVYIANIRRVYSSVDLSHEFPNEYYSITALLGSSLGVLPSARFGGASGSGSVTVRMVGDTNGDGSDDYLIYTMPSGGPAPITTAVGYRLMRGGGGGDEMLSGRPSGVTVTTADFNGDGVQDIVVTEPNGGLYPYPPYLNYRCGPTGGECAFPACGAIDLLTSSWTSIDGSTSDVNHDGYPDLIVYRYVALPDPPHNAGMNDYWTWLGGPDGLTADRCAITPSAP